MDDYTKGYIRGAIAKVMEEITKDRQENPYDAGEQGALWGGFHDGRDDSNDFEDFQ